MKRALSYVLTLVMLLSLLTGCSTQGNLSGTMVDEPCELEEGTFNLYLADNLQGGFTFVQTEGGWTILDENSQYIAYDAENEAIIRTDEAYDWVFSDGSFSTADGTVYLGDGLTVSAEAVPATFTKLVETDPAEDPDADSAEKPIADLAENPKSETTENSAPEGTIASVEVNGETSCYNTFSEAWNVANQNTDKAVIVTLLADVNGANGDFGELQMETRSASLTLDLNDHTLDRGLASSTDNGRVFNLQKKGTFIIKNGTVTGGNCKGSGGCFYVGGGIDLTLEDLAISGNYTTENGSGIYLAAEKSTVTLNNVTITGNTAEDSGAIFWAIDGTKRATLVLKNKIEISSNSGSGGLNNLVYDGHGWCGWLNTDSMGTDSKIGVSYSDGYGGPLADSFGTRVNELKSCFVADQGDHDIGVYGDRLVIKFKQDKIAYIDNGEWTLYSTFAQALSTANWYVSANITLGLLQDMGPEEMSDVGEITMTQRTGTLTLDLNNHTINRGLTTPTDCGAVFNLQEKGTVVIKNGTVTGGNCKGSGGGFYVGGGIDLTLENLTITGNHTTAKGSGIYLTSEKSNVTLNNVTITGNSADESGAVFWAYYDYNRITLVFKNKVEITNNTGDGDLNNLVYDGYGRCGWLNTGNMGTDSKIGVSYWNGSGGPLADSFGSRLDELKKCFFADQSDHEITSGDGTLVVKFKQDKAAVNHNGDWYLYDTFAQAWASANGSDQGTNATMILFGDWRATEKNGFDDNGTYGDSKWFGWSGGLVTGKRENNSWLILDLNGHTINARDYTRIVSVGNIKMRIKNGILENGGNTDYGGAIFINKNQRDCQLDLENLKILYCISEMDGSAIYAENAESVNLKTVTIEWNKVKYTKSSYVGAVTLDHCEVRMHGKVVIRNNSSGKMPGMGENNFSMDDSYIVGMGAPDTMSGSEIHLTWIDIYTTLRAGRDRQITEKNVCSHNASAKLFRIDKGLRDKGYDTVALFEKYAALMLEDH